jgi:hypothetical protein
MKQQPKKTFYISLSVITLNDDGAKTTSDGKLHKVDCLLSLESLKQSNSYAETLFDMQIKRLSREIFKAVKTANPELTQP